MPRRPRSRARRRDTTVCACVAWTGARDGPAGAFRVETGGGVNLSSERPDTRPTVRPRGSAVARAAGPELALSRPRRGPFQGNARRGSPGRRRPAHARRGPRPPGGQTDGDTGRPRRHHTGGRRPRAADHAARSRHTADRMQASQDAPRAEAHEAAGLAEDEVVEDLDAEERAGGGEPAREGDVLGGRFGIAGRVVVAARIAATAGEDRRLEHLARVDERAASGSRRRRCAGRGRGAGWSAWRSRTPRGPPRRCTARASRAASAGMRICGRSASLTPGSRTSAIRKPGMRVRPGWVRGRHGVISTKGAGGGGSPPPPPASLQAAASAAFRYSSRIQALTCLTVSAGAVDRPQVVEVLALGARCRTRATGRSRRRSPSALRQRREADQLHPGQRALLEVDLGLGHQTLGAVLRATNCTCTDLLFFAIALLLCAL